MILMAIDKSTCNWLLGELERMLIERMNSYNQKGDYLVDNDVNDSATDRSGFFFQDRADSYEEVIGIIRKMRRVQCNWKGHGVQE